MSRHDQRGYSLLEALVALMVLSIGLLGVAMLQVKGQRFNSDAYMRTQATTLANDIIDRMRTNQAGLTSGSYVASSAPGSYTDCSTTSCSATQLAGYDLHQWYESLDRFLSPVPAGTNRATITSNGAGEYTITINWSDHDLLVGQRWVVQP